MLLERIVSEGLAHNSYFIGSGTEAAVIDPRRDCDIYSDLAERNGLSLTHIFETHRNEDYAVGSCELAARTGAEIFHGAGLPFQYGTPAREGDRFRLGSLEITVRETPGHTVESLSFILTETQSPDLPLLVFTGDLLFSGDTGRTDLGGEGRGKEMAGAMHDSLTRAILPLPDSAILCPAHGAGSVCGGEISDLPVTTLGYEKKTNPELSLAREDFIRKKIAENQYVPPYFRKMEDGNLNGWSRIRRLPDLRMIHPADLKKIRGTDVQIVDIRSPTAFAGGHIPGSISLWRDGLPGFMGWILDYDRPILIIDDFNLDLDSVKRHFVRLGYDNLSGVLAGGFPSWFKAAGEIASFPAVPVREAARQIGEAQAPFVLDVRDRKNRENRGHLTGDYHSYVGEIPRHLAEIPEDRQIFVYCDAGFKSSLAASILRNHGFRDVTSILGGFTAWENAGLPIDLS
ncbi:MAG: rhodanese-like domain-containing protein [Methanoregulaceae archaeon]